MENAVVKQTEQQNFSISHFQSPDEQIEKASGMARVLQKVVKTAGLSKNFGGKKDHLEYEGWQTLGRFFNATPAIEWSKPIEENGEKIGWEARAVVYNGEGMVIGAAESMCTKQERNWKNKDEYAIRSMAQTRAQSKALRSIFAWVAVLAGYSGTPAEEMDREFTQPAPKPAPTDRDAARQAKKKEVQQAVFEGGEGEPEALNQEMTFGKHKGSTWRHVAETDIGYIKYIAKGDPNKPPSKNTLIARDILEFVSDVEPW